jgi:hypothetical protein
MGFKPYTVGLGLYTVGKKYNGDRMIGVFRPGYPKLNKRIPQPNQNRIRASTASHPGIRLISIGICLDSEEESVILK